MYFLRRIWPKTLRNKLTIATLAIVTLLMIAFAGAFALRTWYILRNALVHETFVIAETIGNASSAALTFRSRADASDLLAGLEAQTEIESALLFAEDGTLLGQYVRKGSEFSAPLQIPSGEFSSFDEHTLNVFHAVHYQDKNIGTVYIKMRTQRVYHALREQIYVVLGVLVFSLILGYLLSALLNFIVTKPIGDLVDTAKRIAIDEVLGFRATKQSDDEIGVLADSFNQMLDRLESREAELRKAQAELSKRVAQLDEEVGYRRAAEKELTNQKFSLERLNERLATSNKELDEFAHVASHDLQEPLRKIQTFGDGLKRKTHGQLDQNSREYLEHMLDCAGRMRELIQDLLELSRVVSKGGVFRSVDLNEVMAKVVSDLAIKIRESGAKIEIQPMPVIEADATQMYRLFQNLIGNSLKYQPPGLSPKVNIKYEELSSGSESAVRISVSDNGIGFEQQHAALIFRPFQRLHGRDEYSGTGIGLAICARIAELHRGGIEARGFPGKGAEFLITLPRRQLGESIDANNHTANSAAS